MIFVDNWDNWRLVVNFVEDYAPGFIGGTDKFYAHALQGELDLS